LEITQVDIEGLKAISEGAKNITTWSISLLGGSILAILSTSYLKPNKWVKLIYVLFIPAWFFLGDAILDGDQIQRRTIMGALHPEMVQVIEDKMNTDYLDQLTCFKTALIILSIWLLLYLIWWILEDFFIKKTENDKP
jgi:hypothetical protein